MPKCIITGANSGIGRSAALQIAEKGWTVVLACRDHEKAMTVCEQIKNATGNPEIYALDVDLSLISSVNNFVSEYYKRFDSLDVLINNAADFDLSRKKPVITSEGNETQFAVNVLAPFALTQKLLPLLEAGDGRIINISSKGLMVYPNIALDFDNLKGEKKYSPASTYYQTKLAMLMNSLCLKEKLAGTCVSVYDVRVTNVKVDITRYGNISPVLKLMYKMKSKFSISPDEMAKVYTELATGEKLPGFCYDEKMNEAEVNRNAYDRAAQARLWDICETLVY
jgi:NAD(P)-dependent dehydrogenase (short-subunit alcohol dehydrogenase family)